MKINELMAKLEELKPNQYSPEQKIKWLDEIERKVWEEVYRHREHDGEDFKEYDIDTDEETKLLAEIYDEFYLYYLMAQIDYFNGEYERYNINASMFENYFQKYKDWYYRTHRGVSDISFKNL